MRSSPLRRGTWPSRSVHSVAPNSAQSCTSAHSRLTSLHLGASRLVQFATASLDLDVLLCAERTAESCTAAHSLLASLHLGASRAAQLAAASRLWPFRCVKSVALSSAQSCTAGPQPPRVALPRSVACCAARRCVASLGRPAACIPSRLVQLKAARQPTAASRLSTSERRASRTSQHRRGIWTSRYVQSVAPSSAQSCTSAHSRLASLHLGASRLVQLAIASRPLNVMLRAEIAPGSAQSCTAAPSRLASFHLGASPHSRLASLHLGALRLVQLATASRHLDVLLRAEHRAWFSSKLHSGPQPPRVTPPRSVACCAARRCVAALERPAACRASRLVQLKAARRPTAIHVTPPRSVAPCAARHCVSRLGRPAVCRAYS